MKLRNYISQNKVYKTKNSTSVCRCLVWLFRYFYIILNAKFLKMCFSLSSLLMSTVLASSWMTSTFTWFKRHWLLMVYSIVSFSKSLCFVLEYLYDLNITFTITSSLLDAIVPCNMCLQGESSADYLEFLPKSQYIHF